MEALACATLSKLLLSLAEVQNSLCQSNPRLSPQISHVGAIEVQTISAQPQLPEGIESAPAVKHLK